MKNKLRINIKNIFFCLTGILFFVLTSCSQQKCIGIAWRSDTSSEFLTNITTTLDDLKIEYVVLDEVIDYNIPYDGDFVSGECVNENDFMVEEYADIVKKETYKNSNVSDVVKNVKAVIFTGGEDISPSLYKKPEDWHKIEAEKDFNVTRDVSDYLLMSYCLDNDIPIIGLCRGSQMLGVISGATVIQDIPTYFSEKNLAYNFEHRNEKATPDSYRDYSSHCVELNKDCILYKIYGKSELSGCPSWHHQALESVEDTSLIVAGYTEVSGINMIEATVRSDKKFAVGLQFHPEAAYVKYLNDADNKNLFMDKETAAKIFLYLNSLL